MRVIAGEQRGLPLKAVPGHSTRPTTDKVKESIFNMIGPFFHGGQGLDLYGGSGSLGIEALSRGLDHVIFVDSDKRAIETIKKNLTFCQLQDKTEVYRNDAKRALGALVKREKSFTHIFLDPPYAKQDLTNELAIIETHELLDEEGVIVCEHDRQVELPQEIGQLTMKRQETYGDTTISIYQRMVEREENEG